MGLIHLDQETSPDPVHYAGIRQGWKQVGGAMVDALVAQMNRNEYGIPAVPKTILIPGTWVDGATVR